MRGILTLSLLLFSALFLIQSVLIPSAFAAREKVIIGFSTAPDWRDEDAIRVIGGKVKYRYSIIPAIAAEVDVEAIEGIRRNPRVDYIEPDQVVQIAEIPDDPSFSLLWGLHNTNGTDADIDAPEAWNITKGSSGVVIAVIDTGVNYNHPDLVANMWTNPWETPGNGIDDDGNGYVDDVYGYDFYNKDNNPMDDHSHGSHCSGTIAGVGNNGIGVVGVNWNARIMALKFLSGSGYGSTSDAIAAVQYAANMKQKGVNVVATSNSWGGGGYSTSLYNAIAASGMLFVAAAGNNGTDNDTAPFYPASYDLDNIISVAATDSSDNKASFSNYGATSVDLAAPGVSIYSTVLGASYGSKSGTSMATPHVSGVVGLVAAQFTNMGPIQIKDKILGSVDVKPSLTGKVLTGGRLNAFNALSGTLPPPPVANFVGSPTSGKAPLTVNFTDLSTNGPTSWLWNFGDGGTSTVKNPSHTYANAGICTVSLTATNAGGSDGEVKIDYITVTAPALQTMYVSSITFSSRISGKNLFLNTIVSVLNGSITPPSPLAGVSVGMTLTYGSKSTSFNGVTGADGTVTFTLKAKPGHYTATVNSLTLAGYKWDVDDPRGITSNSCDLPIGGFNQGADLAAAMAGPELLQNIPNPFNPETWIPFTLPNEEHVIIRIYDISGRLVRTLDLGHKSAGAYMSKGKAAYWDGANENGEKASSGVYFYVMEAGKFRASKRMLVVR